MCGSCQRSEEVVCLKSRWHLGFALILFVTSAVSGKHFISAVLRYFPWCLGTEALWKARSLLQGCGKVYGEFQRRFVVICGGLFFVCLRLEKASWKGWSGRGQRNLGHRCGALRACGCDEGVLQIWGGGVRCLGKLRVFCVEVNNVVLCGWVRDGLSTAVPGGAELSFQR